MSDIQNRSASIATLAGALSKAQAEIEGAEKAKVNPHFKSKYADLASVWDACRKPLTKNDLAILQPVSANGTLVTVTTILAHKSGEWISEALTVKAQQDTPQAVGSAITYGRRYGLASMVGVAPDDDDGQAASQPAQTQQTVVRATPRVAPSEQTINDVQRAELVDLARKAQWTDGAVRGMLTRHGFENSREITVSKFAAIKAELSAEPVTQ